MSRCAYLGSFTPDAPCKCGVTLPAMTEIRLASDGGSAFASFGTKLHWRYNGKQAAICPRRVDGKFELVKLHTHDVLAESPRLCELLLKMRMRGVDI